MRREEGRRERERRRSKGFDFANKRKLYAGRPCVASGKRKFASELDVLIEHMGNPRAMRGYRCSSCDAWHATSQPERTPK